MPRLRPLSRATALLLLCPVLAACGIRTGTFELVPRRIENPTVLPLRVGVVGDKAFLPYKFNYRYWSSTPIRWSLRGLPDAFVDTLGPYFASVELLEGSRSRRISTGQHDLIARMRVDRLHFDGANTTIGRDTVDLTMTFTLGPPTGTEVFRTTLSARETSEYSQRCAFCMPDPPEAFRKAFSAVFAKLSDALAAADIRQVQQERQPASAR